MASAKFARTNGRKKMPAEAQGVDAQEIACVAYELYEQRGRADGHDFEDWLRAEEIVRQRQHPLSRTLI